MTEHPLDGIEDLLEVVVGTMRPEGREFLAAVVSRYSDAVRAETARAERALDLAQRMATAAEAGGMADAESLLKAGETLGRQQAEQARRAAFASGYQEGLTAGAGSLRRSSIEVRRPPNGPEEVVETLADGSTITKRIERDQSGRVIGLVLVE